MCVGYSSFPLERERFSLANRELGVSVAIIKLNTKLCRYQILLMPVDSMSVNLVLEIAISTVIKTYDIFD